MTGELYIAFVKNAHMNGLSNSITHSSSYYLESAAQAGTKLALLLVSARWGFPCFAEQNRGSRFRQSLLLVIYQLLLKNNIKYWVGFLRNVRAGVFS